MTEKLLPNAKEIILEWINELRSGNWKQGKKCLNNVENNSYCCIGVLGEILVKKDLMIKDLSPIIYSDDDFGDLKISVYKYKSDRTGDAFKIIHLDDMLGLPYKFIERLILENDSGNSFSFIADMIEERMTEIYGR